MHPEQLGVSASLERFKDEIRNATRKAVDESFDYTRSLLSDFTDQTCKEIAAKMGEFEKPPVKVIKVGANPEKKLKNRVSPVLDQLVLNATLGFNTLLIGPAGCGKTSAAEQLAESLEMSFGHICLTAGASETWLFGRQTPNGFAEGLFSQFYRDGGVFLADEMDAADPNLLLAINTALAGKQMYNPISGAIIPKSEKFVFVGAANTNGKGADEVYTGRSRLDAATLDRFVLVEVTYCREIEKDICPDEVLRSVLWGLRETVSKAKSKEIVSTRCFDRAFKLSQSGIELGEILKSITLSWPQELKAKALDDARAKAKKIIDSRKGKKALPAPEPEKFDEKDLPF